MKLRKTKFIAIIMLLIVAVALAFTACSSDDVVTVKFYVDEALLTTIKVDVGDSIDDLPEVPYKDGYVGSWSVKNFDEITTDLTVYAIYVPDRYTVYFYDGDTLVHAETQTKNKTIAYIPDVPEKDGYTGAWSVTLFSTVRNDLNVYAVYTQKPVYATFYENAFTYEKATVYQGETVAVGTYYEYDGNDYALTADKTFSSNKDYFVRQRKLYTKLQIIDGVLSEVPTPPTSENRKVKWMTLTRTENGEVLSPFIPSNLNQDTEIVACEYLSISLVDNFGGTTLTSIDTDIGQSLTEIDNPTAEHQDYDFYGWYFDEEYKQKVELSYVFNYNTTLYAKWLSVKTSAGLVYSGNQVVGYDGEDTEVYVPYKYVKDGEEIVVQSIGEGAFASTNAVKIHLPATVTAIDHNAFVNCRNLTSVVYDDGCYVQSVGNSAFEGCVSLKSVEFCENTTTIGARAFYGCTELEQLVNFGVTAISEIADKTFYACSNLSSVVIPETLTKIGDDAFYGATSMRLVADDFDKIEYIGERAFAYANAFSGIDAKNVGYVGENAYLGAKTITSATLTAGSGGIKAFAKTSDLDNLNGFYTVMYDGEEYAIPEYLYTLTIAKGTGTVLQEEFADLYTVKEIVLASEITEIGDRAFALVNYTSTASTLSVTLPDTLTTIGKECFLDRQDLHAIDLPSTVKTIKDRAFYGLLSLSSVTLPSKNDLDELGENVFTNTEWYDDYDGLITLGKIVVGISTAYCVSRDYTVITAEEMALQEKIAPYAFYGNNVLTEINLGERISTVGDYAFADCDNLVTFAFNSNRNAVSNRKLGSSLLQGSDKLADLTVYEDIDYTSLFDIVPSTLTTLRIGYAGTNSIVTKERFGAYVSITQLYVGDGFDTIGEEAFIGSTSLQKVVIGEDVEKVERCAFYELSDLTVLDLTQAQNLKYIEENAFCNTKIDDVVFPNSLVSVSDGAFFGANIKQITFGENLVSIGKSAFENNANLEKVTMQDTVSYIGDYAFKNCKLETFVMPKSIAKEGVGIGILVGNDYFLSLTLWQNLSVNDLFSVSDGENVTITVPVNFSTVRIKQGVIEDKEFYDIDTIQNVYIENGVTEIGISAFENCDGIRNITVPSSVSSINDRAFALCDNLTAVTIETGETYLNTIGKEVFTGDKKLVYAVLPDLTTGDTTGLFDGCEMLVTTSLPKNITVIGDYAYRNCRSLVTVGMHDNVEKIGASAFYGCVKIDFDDVRFDSLTEIGEQAFAYCQAMHGIKAENATLVGQNAYLGCTLIEEITITDQAVGYYVDDLQNITTINVVGSPNETAFDGCSALETVVIYGGEETAITTALSTVDVDTTTVFVNKEMTNLIQEGIAYVYPAEQGDFEFTVDADTHTATLTGIKTRAILGTVYLPSTIISNGEEYTVTAIGETAFSGTRLINKIVIPSTVEEICEGAFYNCVNLSYLKFENGSRLTTIRTAAFDGCISLTKVAFPSSLKTIEKNAFQNCSSLKEIKFFANSALESVGEYAFNGASSLEKVYLTGPIKSIGTNVFNSCVSLVSFDFGEKSKITAISNSLFSGCTSLSGITIPSSVQTIGDSAFKNCTSLTEINIPDSVISIGKSAFNYAGLVTASLGKGLISIGEGAFENCHALTSVEIPDGVTTIGNNAYNGCYGLITLTIGKGVATIGSYAFAGTSALTKVNYNASSASDLTESDKVFNGAGRNTEIAFVIGKDVYFVPAHLLNVGDASDAPQITTLIFEETPSCERIGEYAFAYLDDLVSVVIPVTVLRMGQNVFYGASTLRVAIENATCPTGYLDGWDNGVTTTFGENNVTQGEYTYVVYGNQAFLTAYSGTSESVIVSATIGTYSVASLGMAFEKNEIIKEVTLPSTVTNVGSFYGCVNLETVVLNDSIEYITQKAFYNCVKLDNVVIPASVQEIGSQAFYGCDGLTTVYFNGAKGVSNLDSDESSGYITAHAVSIYVKDTVGTVNIDETVYSLLPVKRGNYNIYTKLYYQAGENAYVYLVKGENGGYDLTVSGTGSMYDYYAYSDVVIPWSAYKDEIFTVTVEKDITTLGRLALNNLTNLEEIYYDAVTATYYENKDVFASSGTAGLKFIIGSDVQTVPSNLLRNNLALTEIVFTDGVLVSIGDYAFYGCTALTQVILPDTVKTVGAYAFAGGKSIAEITVGKGVTTLGERAFYGADNLLTLNYNATGIADFEGNNYVFDSSYDAPLYGGGFGLNVGNEVTKIPAYMFYDCGNLISVSLPLRGALSSIGRESFYKCDALTSINIPTTIESIEPRAFAESTSLATITLASGTSSLNSIGSEAFLNTAFYSEEDNWTVAENATSSMGVLYLGGKYLIKARSGISGEYSVSGGTTLIASEAFEGCNALEFIRLPSTLTYVGENAFDGCSRLKTVYISSAEIAKGLDEESSYGGVIKYALHVYLAETLITDRNIQPGRLLKSDFTAITAQITFTTGTYYAYTKTAWRGNEVVAYLLNDEQNVGYYEIIVDGNGSMDNYSLDNMMPWREYLTSITKATIRLGVTTVGSTAFYGCTELQELFIADSVTSIGEKAFSGCTTLSEIAIPDSVEVLGNGAFSGCVNVQSLRYLGKNIADLGENNEVFANLGQNSANGVTVKIDKYVEYLPSYLFYPSVNQENTPNIKTVEFLSTNNINDVAEIGAYAFAYLVNMTSVKFAKGSTLSSIDEGAFIGCNGLITLDITAGVKYIGKSAFKDCENISTLVFMATEFTEGVEGNAPFEGTGSNVGLTLTISAKTTVVPSHIFEKAQFLSDVEFEEGGICVKIGTYAFEDCVGLTAMTVPDYIQTIEIGAFSGCSALTSYVAPFIGGKEQQVEASEYTLFGYVFGPKEKSGTTYTRQHCGSSETVAYIPDSLTSVEITKFINVYYGSFMNCKHIRTVKLNQNPDADYDEIVRYTINEYGDQVVDVAISNGSVVEKESFSGCVSLTSVTLTERLITIGASAFYGCTTLNEITIHSNVKTIRENAFEDCKGLTKIGFNAIECADTATNGTSTNVFANAGVDKSGIEVSFGKNVTRVPAYLFAVSGKTSPKLSAINFAENAVCSSIGEYAFYDAGKGSLTSISLTRTLTSIGERAFDGTAYYEDNTKWQSGVLYIDGALIKTKLYSSANITSYTVTTGTYIIADRAFGGYLGSDNKIHESNNYLEKVNLPNSVMYIGNYAFAYCYALATVNSEKASLLTSIGSYAFSGCKKLGTEKDGDGMEIGFTLRAGVSSIGEYAFNECEGMTNVYIDGAFVSGSISGDKYSDFGGLLHFATNLYLLGTGNDLIAVSSYIGNNFIRKGESKGYTQYTVIESINS